MCWTRMVSILVRGEAVGGRNLDPQKGAEQIAVAVGTSFA